jgi:Skp family chaperone for outer membrane proteins
MGKVFKAHPSFNQQMQALKTEAEAYQKKLQQDQQELARRNEELRMLDTNSTEFQTKEVEITQASANLELERRNQVRDLMIREARIHFEAYAGITAVIGQYCQEQGVPLVLRFMSDPMKLEEPASIEQGFNNSVIYFQPTRDITDEIIERVARAPATTQR